MEHVNELPITIVYREGLLDLVADTLTQNQLTAPQDSSGQGVFRKLGSFLWSA